MCRSAAEGGRRCSGRSCGAAGARARQARSRARRGLEAARAAGDPDRIAAAEAKYTAVTGGPPPDVGTFAGQLPTTPEPTAPEKPMSKRSEPQPSKPEPTTPASSTQDRIRDAVAKLAREEGGWVGLVDLRKMLGDVDHDEVSRTLREMARTNPNVHLTMEDNRKALTDEDHAAAVDYSGEPQHLICIEKPRDNSAKDRVQAAGVGNASADDLAAALRDPLTPSQIYDAIRAEQKRRGLA
ncbi:hypothetical protein [Amycolatopsis eburnea]|uniref:Uncharacterized protein n=1 Tax=Amycolatopsis eburnea TaxID=2267691 RepID=A0A3R9ETT8_9PSEU|nr:hypothetical protein [Amycolatopsis eburnea]RSD20103.1 hypothetical protein EIY87_18000 [Amycolatopsis eburnea]